MILAGQRPELVEKLVVWGSNSFVTDEDAKMVEPIRDLSKWSAKMREPLEGIFVLLRSPHSSALSVCAT